MGSVHFRTGAPGSSYHIQHSDGDGLGDVGAVDLILRSSEAAARATVDLTSIWKGELVYQNVPVAPP
jgi:hypothetical protein